MPDRDSTSPPRRILLATKDAILRSTRQAIIAGLGYDVVAPATEDEVWNLIKTQPFDLLILGNTLEPETSLHLAAEYRKDQPHGRILEIVKFAGESAAGNPDGTVGNLDGPLALRRAIEDQLAR